MYLSDTIEIAGRQIGPDHPPYIIAELSANHGGDIERAKSIIRIAAEQGADAIKFQAYTADEMTLDSDRAEFTIRADSPWKGQRLHALYQRAATPYAWFPELFALARSHGITPFASPFGAAAVSMLQLLDSPAYKIASFEAIDLGLIDLCARTGKPLIISTGLCTAEEIQDAVSIARNAGAKHIALLRCNSAYPADPKEANLATIPDMRSRFDCLIGYSDHTLNAVQSTIAVGLGACIIEKHVIDSREPATADSSFSCLPEQLGDLVKACHAAWQARGSISYGPQEKEKASLEFRRSLFAIRDIAAGAAIGRDDIASLRPGYGLAPKHLDAVVGRIAKTRISRGDPLTWESIT